MGRPETLLGSSTIIACEWVNERQIIKLVGRTVLYINAVHLPFIIIATVRFHRGALTLTHMQFNEQKGGK